MSALLLASCAGGDASDATRSVSTVTVTATPSAATSSTTTGPGAGPTSQTLGSPTTSKAGPTVQATSFHEPGQGLSRVAVIKSPSRNIGCEFDDDEGTLGCGIESLTHAAGPDEVIPYGTTVVHGRYACRSEETGLTCFSTRTGVGATMNRQSMTQVTGQS